MELASRELGRVKPPRPPGGRRDTQPKAGPPRRHGPRAQAPGARPGRTLGRTDGGAAKPARRNPTSAPPTSGFGARHGPARPNRPQSCRDQNRTPQRMAVIKVEMHTRQEPHELGVSQTSDITMRGQRFDRRARRTATALPRYSVPDSVHCSRASVLPRLGPDRDPAGVALAAPIPHGPRAGQ